MKHLLWRLVYALIGMLIASMIVPLFASVVGFPLAGNVWALLKVTIACLVVLYVLFGPSPAEPF